MIKAYQLVYKIRLNVEQKGFNSCASAMAALNGETVYETNGTTSLSYEKENGSTGKAFFDIPKVRGLLYDIVFKKVDDEGALLSGAEFALYKDEEQIGEKIITDGTTEFYRICNLPWGTYTLRETVAPNGYTAETKEWEITLCYTTDKENLKADIEPYAVNMKWTGNDLIGNDGTSYWEIINKKSKPALIIFQKVSATDPSLSLAGAVFTLYQVDENGNKIEGIEMVSLTSDENGVFSPADFTLAPGTYHLIETKAPDGYHLLIEPVVITVNDKGVSAMCGTSSLEVQEGNQMTYTILVTNSTGTALPETGGAGAEAYQLAGLLLMLTAAVWLCKQKQLRERGNVHSPKA